MLIPESLENLIHALAKLPGIGPKSAKRVAFYLLSQPPEEAHLLSDAIIAAKANIRFCSQCFNYSEEPLCPICSNPKRDTSTICILEKHSDLYAFESSGGFSGVYHVLGNNISPLDGIGPEDIHVPELLKRLDGVTEIILAMSSNADGEATAHFIDRAIGDRPIKRTRLARGIPMGSELEYIDTMTILKALEARTSL
ncbi:MAG: recombination mediator RecR [Fibrobacterales bacterium]